MSTLCSCVDALRCCICDARILLKHHTLNDFMHTERNVTHLYCPRCDEFNQIDDKERND